MHNAFLDLDGEKMSKSLGNFRTVRELLQRYRGEVLRFALLSAHYRSPQNFSVDLLEQAEVTLSSLYGTLREVADVAVDGVETLLSDEPFYAALNDDLNTPQAIAEIHAIAKELNKADAGHQPLLKARLLTAGALMGLLQEDPAAWLQGGASESELSAAAIEQLILDRQQAKLDKNYALADQIRVDLQQKGIVLEDSREGTKWRRT
jgi:cysteinyl-tRNA synthetase